MKPGLTQDQGKLKLVRVTPRQSVVIVDGIPSIYCRLNSAKFIWTENTQKVPLTTLTVFLPARTRTR